MKKFLGILVALSMVFSLPLGVFGDQPNMPSKIKITLDGAYKLIEQNNIEIKLLDKKIELQKQQYNDALEDGKDVGADTLQTRKIRTLVPQQVKLSLESVENDKVEKLKSLKSSVKQQYIDLLLLQNDIAYIKQDISVMDKKLKDVQLRLKLGQAKESEYKSMYSQSLSLQNQLNSLNTQNEISMINLKNALGITLTQPIELEAFTLSNQAVDKVNMAQNIINSINNSFTIKKMQKELDLLDTERKLIKEYSTNVRNSTEYTDIGVEIAEMELQISYQKLTMESGLWIDYYNLLGLEDKIKLAEVNLEIAKINYDAITAKAKLGLVDAITEINSGITYNRQSNSLQNAKYDYIMAVEQFNDDLN
jgi:NOL1/NOP2/fmu family ribosome biogenesis protein